MRLLALKGRYVGVAVLFLLLTLVLQSLGSMRQKSVTVDEITYIAAGYYHLKTGDFSMNATNPPLMKLISALPLLAVNPDLPTVSSPPRDWSLVEQWQYARVFLYENRVDADVILFLSRLPIVAVSALLGVCVFFWSRELYGNAAALLALSLYTFSPNILAHSRLATQDLGLTAFMVCFAYCFWRYVRRPSMGRLLTCGVLFGLAVLSKTLGLFLLPIAFLYAAACVIRKNGLGIHDSLPLVSRIPLDRVRLRQLVSLGTALLLIGLLGLLVLNGGYLFQGSFGPLSDADSHPGLYRLLPVDNAATRWVVDRLLELPAPLPEPYIDGIKFQRKLVGQGRDVYFMGSLYASGSWRFSLAGLAIKTPIPTLLLSALSIVLMASALRRSDSEWLLLSFVGVVLFVFSFLSRTNFAVRYLLPMFPVLFILCGRLTTIGWLRRPAGVGALVLLGAWYLYSSLGIYPHYLAYFNEFVGGPRSGYKCLVGTNLDLGQDLEELARYLKRRGVEKVKLGYHGSADPSYYGVEYDYLPSVGLKPTEPGQRWWYELDAAGRNVKLEPESGTFAVSANLLVGRFYPHAYEWLREREPTAMIGYSILVFDIE